MSKTTRIYVSSRGFVKYDRTSNQYRDVKIRQKDWKEIYNHNGVMKGLQKQAAR
jgi:glutamate synthase (NADPH/NADH)